MRIVSNEGSFWTHRYHEPHYEVRVEPGLPSSLLRATGQLAILWKVLCLPSALQDSLIERFDV